MTHTTTESNPSLGTSPESTNSSSDEMLDELIENLKRAQTYKLNNTLSYRVMIAMLSEESLYPYREKVAVRLSNQFKGFGNTASTDQVVKTAKLLVSLFNDLF